MRSGVLRAGGGSALALLRLPELRCLSAEGAYAGDRYIYIYNIKYISWFRWGGGPTTKKPFFSSSTIKLGQYAGITYRKWIFFFKKKKNKNFLASTAIFCLKKGPKSERFTREGVPRGPDFVLS